MTENISRPDTLILPRAEDMPACKASFIRWFAFFARPYARIFLSFGALRIMRYTVLMMLPLVIGLTIKSFETGWARAHTEQMLLMAGGYMGFYGLCLFTMIFFTRESAAQDRMIRGMTLFSIGHMNRLTLDWHEAQGSGAKLQRVMTARSSLKNLFDMYKWNIVPFTSSMIAIVLSVRVLNAPWFFILFYLGFAGSFIFTAIRAARRLPGLHDRHNKLLEKLMSGVYEFVAAVRTVKAFNMQGYIEEQARLKETEGHGAMREVYRAIFRKWTILNMVAYSWILIFFAACTIGVFQGWLAIGAFATLFFQAYDLWKTLENTVYMQDQFIESYNGFMRLTETLSVVPRPVDIAPVVAAPEFWDRIALDHAGFSYAGKETPALRDISLSIKRGEKIALVGKSGAGKSTLVRLLMKQMLPGTGKITVDGADLSHIDSNGWLGHIGYVPQDVELFNMSIRDNILLDRAGTVDEAQYRRTLEQAALMPLVESLPDGDATIVGERGIRLSGGQRQRLGIARALVRNAELIIFDEATSALDSLSEAAIQEAIDTSFAGKTLIVIAHRLSTVRHVDRIFVLEDGALLEEGSFADLTARGGAFAKLWSMQSGNYGIKKAG